MKIAESVFNGISPLFKGDIQLVDVEYVKRNDGMHLIIYIDKEDGVTIDDCVEVSRLIDEKLEELDPTNNEPYYLDISSYGLDKPLKFDWQFKKYLNKLVRYHCVLPFPTVFPHFRKKQDEDHHKNRYQKHYI